MGGESCTVLGLRLMHKLAMSHNDLVHNKEPASKEKLKSKHCIITSSDLDVMNKHIVREHKFKCQECNATFKEECNLQAHAKTSHKHILVTKLKVWVVG